MGWLSRWTPSVLLSAVTVPGAIWAQDYEYAYINVLEGSATVQRSVEPEPEAAIINIPVMHGDRLWTAGDGRIEVRYGDGSRLRMDALTKVDFVTFSPESLVRVWNGSVILRNEEAARTLRIDSPAGSVYPASAGTFRIDVFEGGASMALSVLDGLAELVSPSGSVLVRPGQRSIVDVGQRPETPFEYNTAQYDEFSAWSDQLTSDYVTRTPIVDDLPDAVDEYAHELDEYGDWEQHEEYGSVWYPTSHVDVSWSPYSSGRWAYTSYGYSWVSYEPWGWAPYHYGRWGHGARGWYWIPGSYWSPAWVSWSIGPTWIGWSPLGYYDRPVYGFGDLYYGGRRLRRGRGGKAIPRSAYEHGGGWNFTERGHLSARRGARARVSASEVRLSASRARVLENGAILNRDLSARSVGAAEMTRARARVRGRNQTLDPAARGERNRTSRGRNGSSIRDRSRIQRGDSPASRTRGAARTRSGDSPAIGTTNPRRVIRDGDADSRRSRTGVRRRGSDTVRSPANNRPGTRIDGPGVRSRGSRTPEPPRNGESPTRIRRSPDRTPPANRTETDRRDGDARSRDVRRDRSPSNRTGTRGSTRGREFFERDRLDSRTRRNADRPNRRTTRPRTTTPNRTTTRPNRTTTRPNRTTTRPNRTTTRPNRTTTRPNRTTTRPNRTTTRPNRTTTRPNRTTTRPNRTTTRPNRTTTRPNRTTTRPSRRTTRPRTTTPNRTTTRPNRTTNRPNRTTTRPSRRTTRPRTTTPNRTTNRPNRTTNRPNRTTNRPNRTTTRPNRTTTRPNRTTTRPNRTTTRPRTTNRPSRTTNRPSSNRSNGRSRGTVRSQRSGNSRSSVRGSSGSSSRSGRSGRAARTRNRNRN